MWIHQSPFCLIFFFQTGGATGGNTINASLENLLFFLAFGRGGVTTRFALMIAIRDSNAARRSLRGRVATRHRRVLGSYRVSRGGAALLHFMRTRVELMAAAFTSPLFIFKVLPIEDKGRKSCIIL